MRTVQGIKTELEKVFKPRQASVLAKVIIDTHSDLVKADDFNELKEIVRELAEAQKELANAQKRTEQKLEELAEAQKGSEKRLTRLEVAVEELANAQKRTEEELRKLVGEHSKTREQVGGLSNTVGYVLEDRAFLSLPELLKKDFGIEVRERIHRRHIKDNKGNYIEVNILGEAVRDEERITIIGEAKSQLSKNDVDEFIRKKLNRFKGVYPKIFPLLVTYMISEPDAEEYAKGKGITIYYSYDFEL